MRANMRNSVNGGAGMWDTAASSPSKTFNQGMKRSGSIGKDSSIRLLNREDLMDGSPLSPA